MRIIIDKNIKKEEYEEAVKIKKKKEPEATTEKQICCSTLDVKDTIKGISV